ncbi:gliding motility-associated C-terminal domain-containing protein [Rufibacter glacialis]|uniref:Gliding motility-associated C-terminal domain-containing protein n=1 Tax=Rufibacter glacialis TaxID=1259555 RepID=A0A5M8Q993_9BACT|nr:gliding motility-associated C-terminal domain-containing protein [Rufibacter glacialis]KAA6432469.1 gliding motility-associated C-terminal domain-containing protein [Rufibacter glacialis]
MPHLNRLIFSLFLLLFSKVYQASGQEAQRLKRLGSEEENAVTSATMNAAGELIMSGSFIYGKGQMPIDNVLLISKAPKNARCGFLARFKADGKVEWSRILESNRYGAFEDIVLDSEGNIYALGSFHGELTFRDKTYTEDSYIPRYFVAKYDASGNPLWLQYVPGEVNIEVVFTIDTKNNLYFACRQGRSTSTSVITTRLVLYKFDKDGAPLLESILSSNTTSGVTHLRDIIVDSKQQPIITGQFMFSMIIGSKLLEGRNLANAFLLKCNADGSVKWAAQVGESEQYNLPTSLVLDELENIYLTGSFSHKSDNISLIQKYHPEGARTWNFQVARKTTVENTGGIYASAIKLNKEDNSILLTGAFKGNVTFGNTFLTTQQRATDGEAFLTKIQPDGQVAGALQSNSDGTTIPSKLFINQQKEFYLVGITVSSTLQLNNVISTKPTNDLDIFLYKEKLSILDPKLVIEPEPEEEKQITIPNIFTPNGDDKNQFFEIINLNKDQKNSLVLYNRWGKQVYHSPSYQNNWEATGLSDGTYFYILYLEKENKTMKGWVNIVR